MGAPKPKSHNLTPVLLLIAVWAASEALINPRGNFPLNDDWCYAKSVYALLHTGKLQFIEIIPMTLAAQVLWGALFCKLFGTSFFALRLSTIALGLIGLIATYSLLRTVGGSRPIAFMGSMLIALNPIYLELSNTYMTDVPFYALALLTIYLFARELRRDSYAGLAAGALLACTATLIRQLGIVLPVAFAAAYLLKNGVRPRTAARAFLPAVITAGTLIGYQKWLLATHRLPLYYTLMTKEVFRFLSDGLGPVAINLAQVTLVILVYLGLFVLPFLVLMRRKSVSPVAIGSFAVLTGALILTRQWMPLKTQPGDIIIDFGVGPATLVDVFINKMPHIVTAPRAFWIVVTLAGAAGGGMLVHQLLQAAKSLASRKGRGSYNAALVAMLLIISAALLLQNVGLSGFAYFDRYFLLLVPFCTAVILLNEGSEVRLRALSLVPAAMILLLYGMFSVGATHDYFSWNRARWQALGDLTKTQRIPTYLIDGGYEFNGWYNYRDGPGQNWWRSVFDDYTLTFGPMPDFERLRSYPFRKWMPPGQGEILVLKRIE